MQLIVKSEPPYLGHAPSLIRSGKYDEFILDLERIDFVNSLRLSIWKCLIELARHEKLKIAVKQPKNENVWNYMRQLKFFDDPSSSLRYHEDNKVLFPLMRIDSDFNEHLYGECEKAFLLSNASLNYVHRLSDSFTELADNVYFHSGQKENTGWGYAHAQVYKKGTLFWKKGYIRVAVSDVGIGMIGSYERTNQVRNRTARQIMAEAFELGESSLNPKPKSGSRGIGLNEVYQFVKHFSGIMMMSSDNVVVTAGEHGLKDAILPYYVDGTWVELEVPIL